MKRSLALLTMLGALAALPTPGAAQQPYPVKPIHMIVPFPSGAIADNIARILGQQLAGSLGQSIVVDNRAGADGTIATEAAIKSAPDGYTILLTTGGPTTQITMLRKNPPYDPMTGLTPLSMLGHFSFFLMVRADLPVNSVAELVAYARANPGKLTSGTGNSGSILLNAQFFKSAGINVLSVPYKGEAPALTDLVAGRTSMMFNATTNPAFGYVKEGKLRILATVLKSRSPLQPDVPTIAEAGHPEVQNTSWAGMFGPAKLPPDITARLSRVINEALVRAEVREALGQQAFETSGSTPEELAEFMKMDVARMKQLYADAGLEPQ